MCFSALENIPPRARAEGVLQLTQAAETDFVSLLPPYPQNPLPLPQYEDVEWHKS